MTALLVLSVALIYGRGKDQRMLVQDNITHELDMYNVPSETYAFTGATNDHVAISLTDPSLDSIQEAIHSLPRDWKKDPKLLVLLCHHRFTRLDSWRAKTSPSLHITQITRTSYLADIDLHAPSARHPIEAAKHFKEVIWHLVSRTRTDQQRISTLLLSQTPKK